MNIIIPMAGMGTRMRPHTLTVPKPLIELAGKAIVHRLVEGIAGVCAEKIEEIAFVIGDFGEDVENQLVEIANSVGAKGKIYYQKEALGTAHAVWCAAPALKGKTVVAFADTLFYADFKIDAEVDSIIWVKKVENPQAYGVVKTNDEGVIDEFVEKPKEFVSDLAIIGIYYFNDGDKLRQELNNIVDNDIRKSGEYQLTTALENLRLKGFKFVPGAVDEWLDCGNKDITVETHQRILARTKGAANIAKSALITNSVINEPCFIGENVEIENSVIGPFVSIGDNSCVSDSIIKNSIIQKETIIEDALITDSMIGNYVRFKGKKIDLSIGDYNQYEIK
ncbi:MAG: sugar phosphate nucleotidyltransferase [Bacteroidales bacterium]|nr:sugar phosphate nucleotidyltransferase [Bacteroidales bacterium]MDD4217443.1 sugar phosphate nucleotidyltransferase [Bacteroidales bacterium]MDY0141944.1 sugar phosphate nucleotidyltransferase [Bacteroidales bacterium]